MTEAGIAAHLTTGAFGRWLRVLPSCESTSDEAARWARGQAAGLPAAPEGAVVIAEAQSRGRGRLGRTWHSPPGESLYLSLVLRPAGRLSPEQAPPLTLLAAVAVAEAVEGLGAAPALKWPNDVLLDGRKVAGILTEMATSGAGIEHLVVGIGVNLDSRHFPAELAGRATSVALALGHPPEARIDRQAFAAALLGRLEAWYLDFLGAGGDGPARVVAAWRQRAHQLGQRIEVASGTETVRGKNLGPAHDGALELAGDNGTVRRVVAGEIAWPADGGSPAPTG